MSENELLKFYGLSTRKFKKSLIVLGAFQTILMLILFLVFMILKDEQIKNIFLVFLIVLEDLIDILFFFFMKKSLKTKEAENSELFNYIRLNTDALIESVSNNALTKLLEESGLFKALVSLDANIAFKNEGIIYFDGKIIGNKEALVIKMVIIPYQSLYSFAAGAFLPKECKMALERHYADFKLYRFNNMKEMNVDIINTLINKKNAFIYTNQEKFIYMEKESNHFSKSSHLTKEILINNIKVVNEMIKEGNKIKNILDKVQD